MRLASPGLLRIFENAGQNPNNSIATPSPLAASVAAAQYANAQIAESLDSWRRPQISSIEAWLVGQWNDARYKSPTVPTLLSSTQELVLWQTIIETDQPDLFDLHAAARLASQAHRLMAEWHIPATTEPWQEQEDAARFHRWRELFRDRCRSEHWITRADLWRLIPRWIPEGLCTPGNVVFVGAFKQFPALQNLQTTLAAKAKIADAADTTKPVPTPIYEFLTFSEEAEHAARWARNILESREASVAVFVPDLASHRSLIERAFRNIFYPGSAHRFVRANRASFIAADSVFHLNAAAPLLDHPMIAGALMLLELARRRIGHAQAGAILRSPFLKGASTERSQRAFADLRLRHKRELDFSFRAVEFAAADCPILAKIFTAVKHVLHAHGPFDANYRLELPAWTAIISDILAAAGWPGDRELTRAEEEIVDAWNNTLSELASLGLVANSTNFDSTVGLLRRVLARTGTQTGSWLSPIQILDASTAPDLSFDASCIIGMSEDTWPPPLNSVPLVPLKLQRAAGVPNSTAQGAASERNRLTTALFQSAPSPIATFSGKIAPVVQAFTKKNSTIEEWPGKLPRQSYAPADLDALVDNQAPPYIANGETRGGTGVIRSQSLCPFKAFAEYRLEARAPEEACFGFDHLDRGKFAHEALRIVWERLQNSSRLRLYPADDLRVLVRDAVSEAVKQRDLNPLDILVTQSERERLEELILDWLEIEKLRKESFEVEMVEGKQTVAIAGLQINLRFDRIDRVKNGKLVLIDYKSGQQTTTKLDGDRPPEPQLLVYAACVGPENVDGVFFGQIAPRDLKGVGFSANKHFPGQSARIRSDWRSFIASSVEKVETLAAGFLAGNAAVDPIKVACGYCQLKPLCRIREAGVDLEGVDGE